jgi:hypothetical protein
MRVRAQGKRPYYAEKKAMKINSGNKIKTSKAISEGRGTVTAIAFIERKRQIAIATSDCLLSFWNSRLQHLVDFADTIIPQVSSLSIYLSALFLSQSLSLCLSLPLSLSRSFFLLTSLHLCSPWHSHFPALSVSLTYVDRDVILFTC